LGSSGDAGQSGALGGLFPIAVVASAADFAGLSVFASSHPIIDSAMPNALMAATIHFVIRISCVVQTFR
jgi:hypothetical protein